MKKGFMKKLIAALCVVFAVVAISATSVMATVAYLTSSAAVSNVFTIGNVGITMTESKVTPDGKLVSDRTNRVDTNTYHLVPNTTYIKDPTIHVNAGSEASYLFVAVRNDIERIACQCGTMSVGLGDASPYDGKGKQMSSSIGHTHIEGVCEKKDGEFVNHATHTHKRTIAEQMEEYGWKKYVKISTGWVYVYVGNLVLSTEDGSLTTGGTATKGQTVTQGNYPLFDEFSTAANADVSTYGAAKITLTAFAIQQAGFAKLEDAWKAVVDTYEYLHTQTA